MTKKGGATDIRLAALFKGKLGSGRQESIVSERAAKLPSLGSEDGDSDADDEDAEQRQRKDDEGTPAKKRARVGVKSPPQASPSPSAASLPPSAEKLNKAGAEGLGGAGGRTAAAPA